MNHENGPRKFSRRDLLLGNIDKAAYATAVALAIGSAESFSQSQISMALASGYETQLKDSPDGTLTDDDKRYLTKKAGDLRKDANKWIDRFLYLGKTSVFLVILGKMQKGPEEKLLKEVSEK